MINFLRDFFDPAVFGGAKRSPKWRQTKKAFAKFSPKICPCGSKKRIQLHHVIPFHIAPELELDFSNLIWLCSKCHLLIAHLRFFPSWNEDVRKDMEWLKQKITNRP